MEPDLQKLEAQLQQLRPALLSDDLLDRLEGAAKGTLMTPRAGDRPIEAMTSKLEPSAMSGDLLDRLTKLVDQVPFPVDEKVVLFPKGSSAPVEERSLPSKWWAAAAAVALAGGLSALMVSPPEAVTEVPSAGVAPTKIDPGAFVPAAFNSGVSGTDDLGVMWTDERKPMRVVRVVYKDVVRFLNEKGEEVAVEVPRVEYLMVPEKID